MPKPDARAAGDRVRARDVRIRAVADVEQRALRALEQHAFAARQPFVDVLDAVDDVRALPLEPPSPRRVASAPALASDCAPRIEVARTECRCGRPST